MAQQDASKGRKSNPRQTLLDTTARLNSIRATLQTLQKAQQLDDSIVAALLTATDALQWLGSATLHTSPSGPAIASLPNSVRDGYVYAAVKIEHALDVIAAESAVTKSSPSLVELIPAVVEDALAQSVGVLRDAIDFAKTSPDLMEAIEQRYVMTQSTLNSFRLWVRAQGAVEKAEEAADSAAESAGATATHSLSDEFATLADREAKAANRFRWLTIALFASVLALTFYVAFIESEKPSIEAGQKLAVAIPGLLLGAYFGREASQHRQTARWAAVLVAQLKSIRAYSVELPEDQQNKLKESFGLRVFLQSPDSVAPGQGAESAPVPSDVAAVLREAADLARAARGNS